MKNVRILAMDLDGLEAFVTGVTNPPEPSSKLKRAAGLYLRGTEPAESATAPHTGVAMMTNSDRVLIQAAARWMYDAAANGAIRAIGPEYWRYKAIMDGLTTLGGNYWLDKESWRQERENDSPVVGQIPRPPENGHVSKGMG